MPPVLILLIGGALGIALGYYLRYVHALSKKESLELSLKEKVLEAEEKALKIVEKAEAKAETFEKEKRQELKEVEDKLTKTEERLIKKEETLDERQSALESEKENVREKIEQIKTIKAQLDSREGELDAKLAEVAGLKKEDAVARIMERVEKESEADVVSRINKLRLRGDEQFDEEARNIITSAIHRIGNSLRVDIMSSTIAVPSEDI